MTQPPRPAYLTNLLFETIDCLLGNSDDTEIPVSHIRKAIRKSMRKLPMKQHFDPAYRAIKRSMRIFRPENDVEFEYTHKEILDHYRKKGWRVTFTPKNAYDPDKRGSYFRFSK